MVNRLICTLSVLFALGCSNICMALTVNVKDAPYNATGNGITDDTAAIQTAVDAVIAAGASGTVNFPSGTYIVSMVEIRIGDYPITLQTLSGNNRAVLKMKDAQGKFNRMFTTCKNRNIWIYESANDSGLLKFSNLDFDCNRGGQGSYQNYELEHQAAIYVDASPAMAGRIRVEVDNCSFYDGAADGMAVCANVEANLHDFTTHDFFRGGVTNGSGYTTIDLSNWTDTSGGELGGLQIESDSAGYNNDWAVQITMTDCTVCTFDLAFYNGSTFTGDNITVTGEGAFYIYAPNSTVNISDSVFYAGGVSNTHIYYPGNTTFNNCTFYATATDSGTVFAPVRIYPNISGGTATNQTCLFQNCDFEVDASVESSDTTYAIWVNADYNTWNNMVRVVGGTIASGYDYGVYFNQGGTGYVKDVTINAATALSWGASGAYYVTATVENVLFGSSVTTSEYLKLYYVNNSLTHTDVFLDSDVNTIASYYSGSGMSSAVYSGARYVTGAVSPLSVNTPGFTGDIYQLDPLPAAGQTFQWRCSSGHKTAATWTAYATMPAADANLIGNWRFDEKTSAGTTARDSSGNGYNGTMTNGPARVKGKTWRGLLFDGSNDYVDVGDQSAFDFGSAQNFTLSAWFKWDGTSQAYQPLVQKGNLNSNSHYMLGVTSGYIKFRMKDSNGNIKDLSAGAATANVWTHVVAVKDSSKMYIYVNGSLAIDFAHSFTGDFSSTYPLRIGFLSYITPPAYVNAGFHGTIDNVRIYNRALNSTEIQSLYAGGL